MKIGYRKPSLKRSIKARTTGKIKRKVKKAVNPFYGKKGMGYIKNPKRAVKNKIYHKTTFGTNDVVRVMAGTNRASSKKPVGYNQSKKIDPITNSCITILFGFLGIHKFINGQTGLGILYLLTGGLLGIGWLIDSIKSVIDAVNDYKQKKQNSAAVSPMIETGPKSSTLPLSSQNNSIELLYQLVIDGVVYNKEYCYNGILIVGMKYHGNIPLFFNEELILKLEEDNPYDSQAIMVLAKRDDLIHIGYIAQNLPCKSVIYDFLKRGDKVIALVDDIEKCTMNIGLYKKAN